MGGKHPKLEVPQTSNERIQTIFPVNLVRPAQSTIGIDVVLRRIHFIAGIYQYEGPSGVIAYLERKPVTCVIGPNFPTTCPSHLPNPSPSSQSNTEKVEKRTAVQVSDLFDPSLLRTENKQGFQDQDHHGNTQPCDTSGNPIRESALYAVNDVSTCVALLVLQTQPGFQAVSRWLHDHKQDVRSKYLTPPSSPQVSATTPSHTSDSKPSDLSSQHASSTRSHPSPSIASDDTKPGSILPPYAFVRVIADLSEYTTPDAFIKELHRRGYLPATSLGQSLVKRSPASPSPLLPSLYDLSDNPFISLAWAVSHRVYLEGGPGYISSSYTYPSSVYLWAEYLYSKRTDLLPPPSHQVSPTSSLSTPPSASVSTPASYKFDPFYLPLVEKAAQICRASSASSLPGYLRQPLVLTRSVCKVTVPANMAAVNDTWYDDVDVRALHPTQPVAGYTTTQEKVALVNDLYSTAGNMSLRLYTRTNPIPCVIGRPSSLPSRLKRSRVKYGKDLSLRVIEDDHHDAPVSDKSSNEGKEEEGGNSSSAVGVQTTLLTTPHHGPATLPIVQKANGVSSPSPSPSSRLTCPNLVLPSLTSLGGHFFDDDHHKHSFIQGTLQSSSQQGRAGKEASTPTFVVPSPRSLQRSLPQSRRDESKQNPNGRPGEDGHPHNNGTSQGLVPGRLKRENSDVQGRSRGGSKDGSTTTMSDIGDSQRGGDTSILPRMFDLEQDDAERLQGDQQDQSIEGGITEIDLDNYSDADDVQDMIDDGEGNDEGNNRILYLVDHHHVAFGLAKSSIPEDKKKVRAIIVSDLSHLRPREFWSTLRECKLCFLRSCGEDIDVTNLPRNVDGLKDDPYRSLAKSVRKRKGRGLYGKGPGFSKINIAFVEFRWADYLRTHSVFLALEEIAIANRQHQQQPPTLSTTNGTQSQQSLEELCDKGYGVDKHLVSDGTSSSIPHTSVISRLEEDDDVVDLACMVCWLPSAQHLPGFINTVVSAGEHEVNALKQAINRQTSRVMALLRQAKSEKR